MKQLRPSRRPRPRLSATARAVKRALLCSSVALSLAGSQALLAQTCTETAANEVTCNGAFTNDVAASVPPADQMPNLSIILGDDMATTVNPGTGVNGVSNTFGGNAGVTSYADINTVNGDAIYVSNATTGSVASYGDLAVDTTSADDNAIDVNATGDIDVTVGGSAVVTSTVGATSIELGSSGNGDVDVDLLYGAYVAAIAGDGDATAVSVDQFKYAGTVDIANAGSVYAYSATGEATGIELSGSKYDGPNTVTNTGSIEAVVGAGEGDAFGIYASLPSPIQGPGGDLTVTNAGDITATVMADGTGEAWGIYAFVHGDGDLTVYNYDTGTIDATVTDGPGDAWAISAYSGGNGAITVVNDGALTGTTVYGYGDAYGITAVAYGDGSIDVSNSASGSIGAYAGGTDGVGGPAYGIYAVAHGAGGVSVTNDGAIVADSAYGQATGAYLYSATGDVSLGNTGTIYAYAGEGYAPVAASLCAGPGASATLDNIGTLGGDVVATCGADVAIDNAGYVYGDVTTADGDDYVYNDGTIAGSIFGGAGDDSIVNEGTLVLDGGTIDLGDPGATGNSFYNNDTLSVNGDSTVDMGLANPLPFCNAGGIDMQDGSGNDSLAIYGDFACGGELSVDVNAAAGTAGILAKLATGVADVLTIYGDVDADSVTTVNVMLNTLQPGIDDDIPIVYVTGTSVAGNFVLGDVDWDAYNSFVDVDFSLNADIDPSNATPDVFSLGIEVTGLSDPGTLAAAVGPGVLSLVNSQITTTRQRFGVLENLPEGGFGLWARVFRDKGSFSPDHSTDDFGPGGNFDWDQSNRGVEAGIDFGVGNAFRLGLIAGRSSADLDLRGSGVGSAELDATSWGLYALMASGGWYLDASYRWIDFDVDINSVASGLDGNGKAEAFNIEAGYAFGSPGSFQVVPQAQYTRTRFKDMDVFTSGSGMTFGFDGGDSSRARLGVALQKSFGDADTGWLFTPYAAFSLVRELDGDFEYAINDTLFGTTGVGGTSHLVELGFTARQDRLAFYGGFSWQDGGAVDGMFGGHLGVRYTFGGATPAPAPVVVAAPAKTCADLDDDGDGINNCDDKCPGTPSGTSVGADGCPVPAPEPEPVMEPKPFRG